MITPCAPSQPSACVIQVQIGRFVACDAVKVQACHSNFNFSHFMIGYFKIQFSTDLTLVLQTLTRRGASTAKVTGWERAKSSSLLQLSHTWRVPWCVESREEGVIPRIVALLLIIFHPQDEEVWELCRFSSFSWYGSDGFQTRYKTLSLQCHWGK